MPCATKDRNMRGENVLVILPTFDIDRFKKETYEVVDDKSHPISSDKISNSLMAFDTAPLPPPPPQKKLRKERRYWLGIWVGNRVHAV